MSAAPRSHRIHDPESRGTIPCPPTPHQARAKADNDRNHDRQDGDSCIILTLPIAEWVGGCATGLDWHNSSDLTLSHAAVRHTGTREMRNSGHRPRWMTGVDVKYPRLARPGAKRRSGCGRVAVNRPLPNYLTSSNDPLSHQATCQSGYGAVCKTVYPGSIPGVASIVDRPLVLVAAFACA